GPAAARSGDGHRRGAPARRSDRARALPAAVPHTSSQFVGQSCTRSTGLLPLASSQFVGHSCTRSTDLLPLASSQFVGHSCTRSTDLLPLASSQFVGHSSIARSALRRPCTWARR